MLHGYLAATHERGQYAQCEGRIVVASNGDYSIYLHLANLDSVAFALRPQGGEATMDDPSQPDVSGWAGTKGSASRTQGLAVSPQPS